MTVRRFPVARKPCPIPAIANPPEIKKSADCLSHAIAGTVRAMTRPSIAICAEGGRRRRRRRCRAPKAALAPGQVAGAFRKVFDAGQQKYVHRSQERPPVQYLGHRNPNARLSVISLSPPHNDTGDANRDRKEFPVAVQRLM